MTLAANSNIKANVKAIVGANSEWITPDWPVPAQVRAFMTARAGGVSRAPYDSLNLGTRCGDDVVAVMANRATLRKYLPAEPVWLRQVHGTKVIDAGKPLKLAGEPEADEGRLAEERPQDRL